jgi:CHASE1-domain containing sensor protein
VLVGVEAGIELFAVQAQVAGELLQPVRQEGPSVLPRLLAVELVVILLVAALIVGAFGRLRG